MLAYLSVFVLILFGAFHFDYRGKTVFKTAYFIFIVIGLILLAGLRYRVGGDSLNYEDYYKYMPELTDATHFIRNDVIFSYQPFYIYFMAICKSINPDYYFYQFIHAIIFNTVVFLFIYKNCKKPFVVSLIFYVFCIYFYFAFDIQREALAICCFLLSYKYLIKGNYLIYYLFVTAAFLFHISAAFLFFLPFFKPVNFNRKFIIIAVLLSLPLVFIKEYIFSFVSLFLVTDSMNTKADIYSKVNFSFSGLLFFYFGRVVTLLPFLFFYVRNKIPDKNWLFAAMLIISVLSQVLVGFERLLNYLYIPYICIFVNMVNVENIKFTSVRKIVVGTVLLNLFFVICVKIVLDLNVTDRQKYQSVFFPYNSVMDKQVVVEREYFMRELWKRRYIYIHRH